MIISNNDKDFVSSYFPELKFVSKNNTPFIEGKLSFVTSLDNREFKVYDPIANIADKNLIKDSYHIEIKFDPNKNIYREVKETGGRLYNATRTKDELLNLHVYPNNGKLCLIGFLDEDSNIDFKSFLCGVVIPFFYDQSSFEKYGNWPRHYYAHGCCGILENYYDLIKGKNGYTDKGLSVKCIKSLKEVYELYEKDRKFNIIKKRALYKKNIRPNWKCICGQSDFKNCDNEMCLSLKILHKNIKEFRLKRVFM
jgi:hypothetical protein